MNFETLLNMFSAEDLKKLSVLGFLGYAGMSVVILFMELFHFSGLVFLAELARLLILLAIGFLFLMLFIKEHNTMDLALGGAILFGTCISFLAALIGISNIYFVAAFTEFFNSLFFLVLAVRVRPKNQMFFLLCVCAFLYCAFAGPFVAVLFKTKFFLRTRGFWMFLKNCGYVVSAGIAAISCKLMQMGE